MKKKTIATNPRSETKVWARREYRRQRFKEVTITLVDKGLFASDPGTLFASDFGPTAQVSTQMTYQQSASYAGTTQIFSYLHHTFYTVRRRWLSATQQRRGIICVAPSATCDAISPRAMCVAHTPRCDANQSSVSHHRLCNMPLPSFTGFNMDRKGNVRRTLPRMRRRWEYMFKPYTTQTIQIQIQIHKLRTS